MGAPSPRPPWSRTNALIAEAAARLGVRVEPLCDAVHSDFLMRLRHGARGVIISKTRSPFLTQVAQTLSNNKFISRHLMRQHGLPTVPCVMIDDDADARDCDAARTLLENHGAVVVKPNWGNRGVGVSAPLRSVDELVRACAWARARDRDCEALIEPYLPGTNLRLSVIGGRFAAAAEVQRPVLRGGSSGAVQVQRLNQDPRRAAAPDERKSLDVIPPEEVVEGLLEVFGLGLDDALPPALELELPSEEAEVIDRGDALHPSWKRVAERACARLGIDVGGVDLRAPLDVFYGPARADMSVLLEVNVLPALHLHALPTQGQARPVFEQFVAYCLSLPGAPPPMDCVELA